jgi:hypothetical protein
VCQATKKVAEKETEMTEMIESKKNDEFLAVLPDQIDVWEEVKGDLTTLEGATRHVLAQHDADGERTDVKIDDMREWLISRSDDSPVASIFRHDSPVYTLRRTGFGHLCERAGAPPEYMRRIPVRHALPALNWGLANPPGDKSKTATLRLAGGEVRAILSGRYACYDDSLVLPQLSAAFKAGYVLDSVEVRAIGTGLSTVVRMSVDVDATTIAVPGTDDVVEIAIDVSNNEVGGGAIHVAPVAYLRDHKLAARLPGFAVRHVGNTTRLVAELKEKLPGVLADARMLRANIAKSVDRSVADLVAEASRLHDNGLTIAEARDVVRDVARSRSVELPRDTDGWAGPLSTIANVRAYDVFLAVSGLGVGRSVTRRLALEGVAAGYLARSK